MVSIAHHTRLSSRRSSFIKLNQDRFFTPQRLTVRALQTENQFDLDQIVKDLADRWKNVEDKPSVLFYGAGATFLLWFTTAIIGALDSIPILPKILEVVGFSYSAWFTYRYMLFKSTRAELIS